MGNNVSKEPTANIFGLEEQMESKGLFFRPENGDTRFP
jgi:hypothetical protein